VPSEQVGSKTVEWTLRQIRRGTKSIDADVMARYVASSLRDRFDELVQWASGRYDHSRSLGTEEVAPNLFHANFLDPKGRASYLRIALDDESKVRSLAFLRPLPADIKVRPATAADWSRVAALEPRCPTVNRQGTSTAIDRGQRGADHFRLQGEVALSVAESNGELVGARALPVRNCVLDGIPRRLMFSHFVRVLPEYQSIGLYPHLHVVAREQVIGADRTFAYMDPENDAMRAALGGQRGWNHRVRQVFVNCAVQSDPADSKVAHIADNLDDLCRLINAANGSKFFFSPYTSASLTERLSRAPHCYSIHNFLANADATLGIYWEGQQRTTTQRNGEVRRTIHGTIMDLGFQGDPERGGLEALIREACREAVIRGMSHLTVFTSDNAPEAALLTRLAEDTHAFEFFGPGDEPADIASRGLYVDAIYF